MDIITRSEAIAAGLTKYFNGKPCPRGHFAERNVSGRSCLECDRLWRIANRNRLLEYWNDYRSANIEKVRFRVRRYKKNNPDKVRSDKKIQNHARRARKVNAVGSHTIGQITELFGRQREKCSNCNRKLTVINRNLDHMVPLAKGGSNDINNLQWLCKWCNCRKHAKDPILWANENGRLL